MKACSLKELRTELDHCPPEQLKLLCIRLAKYKKENKELLTYFLFEAEDEAAYITSVKKEMDEAFAGMNKRSTYLIKKSLRKILRDTTRHIKYSTLKTTELDLLIYFCRKIRTDKIPLRSPALRNLYARQVYKIDQLLNKLHEDIQLDYQDQVDFLKS